MKQKFLKFAKLTLCAVVAPAALAQQPGSKANHGSQPGTELIAWTQAPQLGRPPSPQPLRQDARLAGQRADQQSASGQQQGETQKQSATQTFAGTIMKSGTQYVLRTQDNVTYLLDDQERAKKYEGKQVQVIGSLDESSGTIHVEDVKAAA